MNSREYWRKREDEFRQSNLKSEVEYSENVKKIYDLMLDDVQREIDSFYAKYAKKEGITMAEAKRRASKMDIEEYSRKAQKYVKERDFSKQANDEMRLYNLTMKVNRLELLKANIGLEMVSSYDELQQFFDETLTERTLDEFKRQAGILGETIKDNAKNVSSIVNTSFYNAVWSERIWMNQTLLKAELEKLLARGLIQGKGARELASELRKVFGVSQKQAETLMITELARVQSQAAQHSMMENGNSEYEYMATGPNPCDVCKKLDGKVFDVRKMMPGTNAPPMHPRCHCSTAPHWNEEKYQAWLEEENKRFKSQIRSNGENLKERGKKPITAITQQAIDRIKLIKTKNMTKEQAEKLRNKHKELLRIAMEENNSLETAIILSSDMERQKVIYGTETSIEFGNITTGKDSFVLHNHPRNSYFSIDDIMVFVDDDCMKYITIVKNNGDVEILTKTYSYSNIKAKTMLIRLIKSVNKKKNSADIDWDNCVRKYVEKMLKEGMFE